MHLSVEAWLSATEEPSPTPPRTKRFLASTEITARKRRRLSDNPRHRRERSWSEDDAPLLSDLPRLPLKQHGSTPRSPKATLFAPMDTGGAMDPPPTPSSSGRKRVPTPSSHSARSTTCSSRDTSDAIKSSTYRDGVLEPNGVRFRHERLPLPPDIDRYYAALVHNQQCDDALMSLADAEDLSGQLFAIDAHEEKQFLDALEYPGPFPPYKIRDTHFKNTIRCTNGRWFDEEAMPRGPDLVYPKIVKARPDFAYGYSKLCFDPKQLSFLLRSSIYHIAAGLICPFLVIEGKSQACGLNVWQASNQCAGAGSACVKAALTLSEQLPDQAKDGLEEIDCTSYSVAVDTALAMLYVHWSDAPGQYTLQCVDQYLIRKPADLIRLQTHLRNIVTWGMGPRLKKIKLSVNAILDSQDKSKKRDIGNVDA